MDTANFKLHAAIGLSRTARDAMTAVIIGYKGYYIANLKTVSASGID
jgi:hypothetical protein